MVAVIKDSFCNGSDNLCDWVQNFRAKQKIMKRRLRDGDLRVRALLTMAVLNVERQLRQRQQDSYKRWYQIQATPTDLKPDNCNCTREREEIDDLWKNELGDLDQFMKGLSKIRTGKQQNCSFRRQTSAIS